MIAILVAWAAVLAQEPPSDELKCPGVWYDSTACACPKGKADCCPCGKCVGGAECPCMDALRKGRGTIQGTVKSPWFKKSEGVLFLREIQDGKFSPLRSNRVVDQKQLAFSPRIVPLLVGSTLEFHNNDPVKHNVNSPDHERFDLGNWLQGEARSYTFKKTGVYTLLCSVHPEMSGFVVVCQNPYFAVANKADGSFEIRNVPAGTYKLALYHERVDADDLEVKVEESKAAVVEFSKFRKRKG